MCRLQRRCRCYRIEADRFSLIRLSTWIFKYCVSNTDKKLPMKVVFLASIATEEYKLKNNDFDIIKPQIVTASEAQG